MILFPLPLFLLPCVIVRAIHRFFLMALCLCVSPSSLLPFAFSSLFLFPPCPLRFPKKVIPLIQGIGMSNAEEIFDSFTYKDYKKWADGLRYELIRGEAFMMSAPDERHHDLVTEIYSQLRDFLSNSHCKPFIAPFDVRLFPVDDETDDTIVQPDVFVVCDRKKLIDGKSCKGAPDFIVEVISQSSKNMDLFTKKDLYCRAGVNEYWVLSPKKMGSFILKNSIYVETVYKGFPDSIEIPVSVLPGCTVKLKLA